MVDGVGRRDPQPSGHEVIEPSARGQLKTILNWPVPGSLPISRSLETIQCGGRLVLGTIRESRAGGGTQVSDGGSIRATGDGESNCRNGANRRGTGNEHAQ